MIAALSTPARDELAAEAPACKLPREPDSVSMPAANAGAPVCSFAKLSSPPTRAVDPPTSVLESLSDPSEETRSPMLPTKDCTPSFSFPAWTSSPAVSFASSLAPAATLLVPSDCSLPAPSATPLAPEATWSAPSFSWFAPATRDCVPSFSANVPPDKVPKPPSSDDAPETRLPRPVSSVSAPSLSVPRFDMMATLPSCAVIRPFFKSSAPSAAFWMSLPESATRPSTVVQYSAATVSLTRVRTSFHTVSPIWDANMFSLWL